MHERRARKIHGLVAEQPAHGLRARAGDVGQRRGHAGLPDAVRGARPHRPAARRRAASPRTRTRTASCASAPSERVNQPATRGAAARVRAGRRDRRPRASGCRRGARPARRRSPGRGPCPRRARRCRGRSAPAPRSRSAAGIPGPSSSTSSSTGAASPPRSATRTSPPARPCRAEFSSRLSSSMRRLSGSPSTHGPWRRRVERRADLRVAAAQVDERGVGELGEVDALGARGRPGLAAGERLELLDERRQAPRVGTRRVDRAGRELASRLVSGVRSSWPASAAKRRALSSACAGPRRRRRAARASR